MDRPHVLQGYVGVYEVEIWVENSNYLPFPTAMGNRNMQPAPAIVTVEGGGIEFLEGKKRTAINSIAGNKNTKLHWLIQSESPVTLNVKLESKSAWSDNTQIKLGGSK